MDDAFGDLDIPDFDAEGKAVPAAAAHAPRDAGVQAAPPRPVPPPQLPPAAAPLPPAAAPLPPVAVSASSVHQQSTALSTLPAGPAPPPPAPPAAPSAAAPQPPQQPPRPAGLAFNVPAQRGGVPIAMPRELQGGGSVSGLLSTFGDVLPDLNALVSLMPAPLPPPPGAASAEAGRQPLANKLQLLANPEQRRNPLLPYIKHAWLEFAPMTADFVMGASAAALYLSLKFHALKPNYLLKRLKGLGREYKLRVILVQVDMPDADHLLLSVQRAAIFGDATVVCAFSLAEAARYLETFKAYEHKPATVIQAKSEDAYLPKVQDIFTEVRSVNKTDVLTLLSNFGSVAGILQAAPEALSQCPGFGEKKVQRLVEAMTAPLEGSGGGGGSGGGRS